MSICKWLPHQAARSGESCSPDAARAVAQRGEPFYPAALAPLRSISDDIAVRTQYCLVSSPPSRRHDILIGSNGLKGGFCGRTMRGPHLCARFLTGGAVARL